MAGTITALELQKQSRDRINVYLDGEYAFSLAVFAAGNLKVGVLLSDEQITHLRTADEVERARSRVLDYLSYRPRSEWEIREYLQKRAFSLTAIDTVVSALYEVNLINDSAFAQYWLENRAQFRPKGKRILSQELRQKGVSSQLIDETLEAYDEEEAARRTYEEQARRLKNLPPDVFRRRLMERMMRRGFSYDLIQEQFANHELSQSLYINNEED
jgi:regulatory protein